MKFWYKFLFLSVFVLAFTGCGKDEVEVEDEEQEQEQEQEQDEPTYVEPYHSLDMKTDDGKVTQLLKHKVGKGIPIVILGEGFVDKDIKGGVFREATSKAVDALFSVYPMSALKDYFDVYEVTAVSYNDYMAVWTNLTEKGVYISDTAFGVNVAEEYQHGWESCIKAGDEKKIVEYAKKAIAGDRINDATIFVLINDTFTDALSYSLDGYNASPRDIPTGGAIAYVTTMNITHTYTSPVDLDFSDTFKAALVREFGHSFAKLSYENYGEDNGRIPRSEESFIRDNQSYGFYCNVSLSSDVTKSPWADFAADSRYDFEELGCYEGVGDYSKGVYRATYESAMIAWRNIINFNAAQRSMIYKRCMNIAYGDSWEYDYEKFVEFDLEGAKAWKAAHPTTVYSKAKALSARKTKTVKVSR